MLNRFKNPLNKARYLLRCVGYISLGGSPPRRRGSGRLCCVQKQADDGTAGSRKAARVRAGFLGRKNQETHQVGISQTGLHMVNKLQKISVFCRGAFFGQSIVHET